MDYEYYANPLENYTSEGDFNHEFDSGDNPSPGRGPAQIHTHSDDFYDEIENSVYMLKFLIPSFFILCSFIFPIP
jgi:hypothetical protein